MEGANRRLSEVMAAIRGDSRANSLVDEVLNACFDYVLVPCGKEYDVDVSNRLLGQVMTSLDRVNLHLKSNGLLTDGGLFSGTPEEAARWAQDLTWQIWENRPD